MNWDSEKNVVKIIEKWLKKKGFIEKLNKKDKIHGVDIQRWSKKWRKYWFIECKGFPSKEYVRKVGEKSKASSLAQRYTWFTTAIGQIALRMKQDNGFYGVAFPYYKYYHDKILDLNTGSNQTHIKIFRKRTKLNFFLVDKHGEIYQLTPNSIEFKKVN